MKGYTMAHLKNILDANAEDADAAKRNAEILAAGEKLAETRKDG
jgi:hypothetical protein